MFRVITKRLDHRRNWIVETGPWHVSRSDAENWAEILRDLGYNAQVEGQHDRLEPDNPVDHSNGQIDADLLDALSNMA